MPSPRALDRGWHCPLPALRLPLSRIVTECISVALSHRDFDLLLLPQGMNAVFYKASSQNLSHWELQIKHSQNLAAGEHSCWVSQLDFHSLKQVTFR